MNVTETKHRIEDAQYQVWQHANGRYVLVGCYQELREAVFAAIAMGIGNDSAAITRTVSFEVSVQEVELQESGTHPSLEEEDVDVPNFIRRPLR
jgi:hypothetical protein